MTQPHVSPARRRGRRAFTLVELMVSIALALLLLLGVNQVMKTTTTTVGTGYATSQVMRQQMSVDKAFDRDFAVAVPASQQPFILIHSQQQPAFMDRADLNGDVDGNVYTADLDGNGVEGEATVFGESVGPQPAIYGRRSHRVDTIAFFGRDIDSPFRRQTGDQTTNTGFVSDDQSSEAFLWLGHLRLPNNTTPPDPRGYVAGGGGGHYFVPGQAASATNTAGQNLSANPNNFVVSDWALGHQAILLKAAPSSTSDYIRNTGGLAPILATSSSNVTDPDLPTPASPWLIPHSRFDLAEASISEYRAQIETLQAVPGGLPSNWYQLLAYRFNGKPWITKPPTTATPLEYMEDMTREMALTAPFLFRGCSQFMIEFAGDFIAQDNNPTSATYGNVIATTPPGLTDGVVDYIMVGGPAGTRKTRWYGLPRDVSGDLASGGPNGAITAADGDVVPVRDVAGAPKAFERDVNTTLPQQPDYLAAGAMAPGASYICCWSPAELNSADPTTFVPPTMFRVVMQLTDPQGRLGEGPVTEFVYTLPKY